MKSYNETVNDVFRRMNEYETAQKRKRKIITRTATGLCCVCMIAIVGIGSHHVITTSSLGNGQTSVDVGNAVSANQYHVNDRTENNHNNPAVTTTPETPANLPNNAGIVIPPKQVVRSYPYSESGKYRAPKNGEILITGSFRNAMKEYGDSVVYEVEVYLMENAETYLTDELEWSMEYERISKNMGDGQLGLSTYKDSDGQTYYMLLGVVSKDFIENFPVDDQYGYFVMLSGDTGGCSAQVPDVSVYNGVFSYKD